MSPLSSCYARLSPPIFILFFFNDTATTEIYTLSLHDALPISSAPLRLVIDDVDRDHPVVSDRSIKAEVGGGVVLRSEGRKAQMIRVLGPRKVWRDLFDGHEGSPVVSIGRLRTTLGPFGVRGAPGGAP